MTEQAIVKPLPKTVADLINQRKGRFERTMNDYVEEYYLRLWETPEFKKWLWATTDGEAVEGSWNCDDHEAARMLRDYARKENSPVKDKPLASYKLALKVVMRRYQMTRKERAITLGDKLVPAE
jgi:hypothetical protein